MSVIICRATCWACKFDHHQDPPKPHTWMDTDDAEFAGHPWPLPQDVADANVCACRCAGGPGGCQTVGVPDA